MPVNTSSIYRNRHTVVDPEVKIEDCNPPIHPTEPKILWYKGHILYSLPFKFQGGELLPAVDNRHPRQKSFIPRGLEQLWRHTAQRPRMLVVYKPHRATPIVARNVSPTKKRGVGVSR